MNREWVIAGIVALLAHALLLFGFRMETAAVPLPATDTAVDVSLVAAPAPAPAAPVPPVEPAPTPAPTVPDPTPAIQPAAVPREQAPHHEPTKPSHPNPTAPKATGPTQAARITSTAAASTGGVGGSSTPVRPRYNPKPPYPAEARRLGQQGRVLLEVQVSADGRATSVSVKRSSGFAILDNAAVQGVERWTFEPARVAGLPIASRADVPVSFSLAP